MTLARNTLLLLLALATSLPASADDWQFWKVTGLAENGERWASCVAAPMTEVADSLGHNAAEAFNWTLIVSDGTIYGGELLGAEDVYRPWLNIFTRVDVQARSRPTEGVQPSLSCDVSYGRFDCDFERTEYRLTLQLDGENRRHDLWAAQFTYRLHDESGNYIRNQAAAVLSDYPLEEMFGTDDRRSLKFNMSGILDQSKEGVQQHWMALRTTYSYGRDAIKQLRRCVDQHLKAGRWQDVSETSAAAAQHAMMGRIR